MVVVVSIVLALASSGFGPTVSWAASLSALIPEPGDSRLRMKDPQAAQRTPGIVRAKSTVEALARLNALERLHDERTHFQTGTQTDLLDYYRAKRELALWYLRSLLRGQVSDWVRSSKEYFRTERVRDSIRARARSPVGGGVSEEGPVAPAATVTNDDHGFDFSVFIEDASRFVERLTGEGWKVALGQGGDCYFHLDPQSSVVSGKLLSQALDAHVSFRVLPKNSEIPFSGQNGEGREQLLDFSIARTVPLIGATGAVQYQFFQKALSCAVQRQIAGPLAAQVSQSWRVQRFATTAASAGLSLSLAF